MKRGDDGSVDSVRAYGWAVRLISKAKQLLTFFCFDSPNEMIERNYGKLIRSDGAAPLRALLAGKTETLTETLRQDPLHRLVQVPEKTGATRRNRTGDLLITNQLLYQLS